jgi:hypothetical protein
MVEWVLININPKNFEKFNRKFYKLFLYQEYDNIYETYKFFGGDIEHSLSDYKNLKVRKLLL